MAEILLDQVLHGDCLEILATFPEKSVDLIFADPPYNLQLSQELWRPNMTKVDAVDEAWDHFDGFEAYDAFSQAWLSACRRVMKDDGSLWVIGSYHNIFRLGTILQDLGYWILNDVLWIKTNPMPNFRGVRFTNAHETLIWASKSKDAKYTFNHQAMKVFNEGKQLRSDWVLPICSGNERLKVNGKKAHATQKPEALLYRVILAASNPGDVVLDPFFGTGTTGAVAKALHRHWIGIEAEERYVRLARERINSVSAEPYDEKAFDVRDRRRRLKRVPFVHLIAHGLIKPGQKLIFQQDPARIAVVKPDGNLRLPDFEGSIHQAAHQMTGGKPCNGWMHWFYLAEDGKLLPIDELRRKLRELMGENS